MFTEELEMEESEAVIVTSKKTRNYIPNDVTLSILSKLPLKSLKRFESACKSWSLLLQNSYFINIFNTNLVSISKDDDDDTYFISQYLKDDYSIHSKFYFLPGGVFKKKVKIGWPRQFQEYNINDDICILGSVSINGIFCLKQNYNGRPVLWNPTTGESKVIPRRRLRSVPLCLSTQYVIQGFGYDSLTDDYKVIQLIDYHLVNNENKSSYKSSWELYSLRNNSWKELDTCIPNRHYNRLARSIGVYVDGVSHWWVRSDYQFDVEECLVSFDFNNEVLFTTPAPLYLDVSPRPLCVERAEKNMEEHGEKHLVILKKSIALISTYIMSSTFDISILGELGVRESWTKLYVIDHLPFTGVGIKTDGKPARVDLNTKIIEEGLGVNLWDYGCRIGKYKKNPLPMRRTRPRYF